MSPLPALDASSMSTPRKLLDSSQFSTPGSSGGAYGAGNNKERKKSLSHRLICTRFSNRTFEEKRVHVSLHFPSPWSGRSVNSVFLSSQQGVGGAQSSLLGSCSYIAPRVSQSGEGSRDVAAVYFPSSRAVQRKHQDNEKSSRNNSWFRQSFWSFYINPGTEFTAYCWGFTLVTADTPGDHTVEGQYRNYSWSPRPLTVALVLWFLLFSFSSFFIFSFTYFYPLPLSLSSFSFALFLLLLFIFLFLLFCIRLFHFLFSSFSPSAPFLLSPSLLFPFLYAFHFCSFLFLPSPSIILLFPLLFPLLFFFLIFSVSVFLSSATSLLSPIILQCLFFFHNFLPSFCYSSVSFAS